MEAALPVILSSVVATCALMCITWLLALRIQNFSIVDIVWSLNFTVIAVISWYMADAAPARKLIYCGLLCAWSLRLTFYLGGRVLAHIHEEEGRYKQLRREWAASLNTKFFWFYQSQAFSNVFLCIPFFIAGLNTRPQISYVEYAGAGVWLTGIAGEAIADYQLKRFKQNSTNAGKVCEVGLWYYSRHPNYFFQLMIWTGVFVFSLGSTWGWISMVCVLSIAYLLFKVTGIPMTEEQALRSKGEAYRSYQQRTSMIVPWWKKERG